MVSFHLDLKHFCYVINFTFSCFKHTASCRKHSPGIALDTVRSSMLIEKHIPCFMYFQYIILLNAHSTAMRLWLDKATKIQRSWFAQDLTAGEMQVRNLKLESSDFKLRLRPLHDATSHQTMWFRGQNIGGGVGDLALISNVQSFGIVRRLPYFFRSFSYL